MTPVKFKIFICLLIGTLVFLLWQINHQPDNLQVDFLNIGQGDAILIQTPGGQNILIDGGPDNTLLHELGDALPWWERKIDYVIISHYHADHLIGLIGLLDRYQVENLLVTAHQPADDFLYRIWQEKLSAQNLIAQTALPGQRWQTGENLSWQVLAADSNHEDYNENSLVIKLTYDQIDFLFTGDLPQTEEQELIKTDFDLSAEVLKVGHHGSKYSSGEDFLSQVKPELCVIQSGQDNKFHHPHAEALQRLSQAGCQIQRNDLQGAIEVFSDGQAWWLKSD